MQREGSTGCRKSDKEKEESGKFWGGKNRYSTHILRTNEYKLLPGAVKRDEERQTTEKRPQTRGRWWCLLANDEDGDIAGKLDGTVGAVNRQQGRTHHGRR